MCRQAPAPRGAETAAHETLPNRTAYERINAKEAIVMKDRRKARHPEDEAENAVSATEQTGLIPALPEDDEEEAAYKALYPIPRQRENVRRGR